MCSRVWGFCCKWSPNSSANLVSFSRHTVVRDWKTWSCTDACVDRFEVCAMLSKAIPHFLRLTVAQIPCWRWGHTRMNGPSSVGSGLLPPLFLPAIFPVARNCSTNVFTVFLAGASLHLCWFLNQRWTATIEFVCRNHSTIRVFCSVVSCGAILYDVTGASVAKYGKKY